MNARILRGIEGYALAIGLTSLIWELQTYIASFSNPEGHVDIVTNSVGERLGETVILAIGLPCLLFLIIRWVRTAKGERNRRAIEEERDGKE